MSGWNFLSKAEGFLDRVLEEQSKDKKNASDIKVSDISRASTPVSRWQEKLTKAASQLASGAVEEVKVVDNVVNGSSPVALGETPEVDTDDRNELQRSAVFPANMPSVEPVEINHDKRASFQSTRSTMDTTSVEVPSMSHIELSKLCTALKNDLQECEERRMEEAQLNAERISALESRLSFFTGEQVSTAGAISKSAHATDFQKLLAEKDQRIALLLEEGDSLSKKELTHMSNLKKLRSRISDLEGLIATSLKAVEKAEDASVGLKAENSEISDNLRRAELKAKDLARFEIEAADLRREKQAQSRTITDLKRQLKDADDTISQNVTIWTQLQSEKTKNNSLQQKIGDLLLEAKVTAEENASEVAELQGKLDRLAERSKTAEEEAGTEISRLEREIEELRASLEENTSGASESSQTKLLRQIESLQTQYSLARQNWTRIEESLVLRSGHAERERDELRSEEEELRNRLRQLVIQKKAAEEEKSAAYSKSRALEGTLRDLTDQISIAEKKRHEAEQTLNLQNQAWLREREVLLASIEAQVQEKLAEERSAYAQTNYFQDRSFSFQRHVPDLPQTPDRQRPSLASRRSTQGTRIPPRRGTPSGASISEDTSIKSPPITEDVLSPNAPSSQRNPTEISISTIGGHTNVGMMERITANARKLELEMQIMREDLNRMTRQRDEARDECVAMESIRNDIHESKRAVSVLTEQRDKLQGKFEATLELLGEQTEENEQLKEDIIDMRKMLAEISSSKVG